MTAPPERRLGGSATDERSAPHLAPWQGERTHGQTRTPQCNAPGGAAQPVMRSRGQPLSGHTERRGIAQREGAHHGIAAIEPMGEPVEEQVLPQSWGLALGMAERQAGCCCLSSHPGLPGSACSPAA
jgi:hypothetical protein